MSWFKRKRAGIQTTRREQNSVPEGQWVKCPECKEIVNRRELKDHLLVCPKCDHHFRLSSEDYFKLLLGEGQYELHDEDLRSVDPLDFSDRKPYDERLASAREETGQHEAARAATGTLGAHRVSVAALDFSFIGGSMGSVVGEMVTRSIKRACREECPLIIVSQSGGARMMEGALSLMQMAKTSAHLARLSEKGLPYLSLMTHPTTGGVTASFAMLGDVNLAEPKALIGFAGPRVIRETIGSDLPEGFQRAEFLKEHGFVDRIVERGALKDELEHLLDLLMEREG
ncbi:MAG: acetyl-CoA carboxylase carboxyl transferase subunit beta [Bacteroidetes bacterium SW_4_67_19]|jgi:acetyl-CoA carboxylase carboxyl transferase subunit beta|nr:MAG: acetyl-CoA carboxylase carboxyl transferase subunit beta [Bacteroidetes bacterium QH_8_67_23]PSQ92895.1 MAG: acetyl-CoA carboxylase carboxyl transferase subunit beta [Bacteroidetes bacterium SW_4_67_19]